MDVITKASENSINLSRKTETTTENVIEYDALLTQYKAIQEAQKAANASYEAQLADVRSLLAEADKLGVKSKTKATKDEIEGKK
jgi:hypothetical protein